MKFVFANDPRPWRDRVMMEGGVRHILVSFYYVKDKAPSVLCYGRRYDKPETD